jgi:hypothetical protein
MNDTGNPDAGEELIMSKTVDGGSGSPDCSLRLDGRTRQGIENTVMEKVKSDGGFSVFWACANSGRANAIQRLSDAGRIKRIRRGRFPWCPYRVIE